MNGARPARRWIRVVAGWVGLALVLFALGLLISGWRAFGKRAAGERLARIERSPEWHDGHFVNPEPLQNDWWGALAGAFHASDYGSPTPPLVVEPIDPQRFDKPPRSGLRATWLGHAAMLIEIDGRRVLTDPVWSERASPFSWIGPRRWYRPPIALADLPSLDAVLISHDHYDHLDYRTIVALKDRELTFVVPLGIGAHLEYWGVAPSRIVELDWWEHATVNGLDIVSTPARHASGRVVVDDDTKLWSSYALIGPNHRAFFSGDTGLFPALEQIGQRFGPFDLTMIEVGQYHRSWPDWHIGPEQAIMAHGLLRGRTLLPMHWGLFSLAYHGWTEPAERVLAAAQAHSVNVVLPKPGQSIEPDAPHTTARWWPDVPWESADVSPVVSSGMR
ncbi:MAG TPA: MBL fold metallo-hydrolase [Polyangiaceae bacterium]|nr:MBL fold metallo-hydrolase [Polyangiaceae bacterium]